MNRRNEYFMEYNGNEIEKDGEHNKAPQVEDDADDNDTREETDDGIHI